MIKKKSTLSRDHLYMSTTGSIFILTKFGEKWYLVGDPLIKESKMLWPVGVAASFQKINSYVIRQLGLVELR